MRTLIISDTHGSLPDVEQVLRVCGPVDRILHAGDVLYHGPRNRLPNGYTPKDLAEFLSGLEYISYVRGNCDAEVDRMVLGGVDMPEERLEQIGGLSIYLQHGHRMDETERVRRAKELGAKIAVSGHTHIAVLRMAGEVAVLNPGSTTLPKDNAKSFALLEDGWLFLRHAENGRIIAALDLA
jgi:putative phosphoesterase